MDLKLSMGRFNDYGGIGGIPNIIGESCYALVVIWIIARHVLILCTYRNLDAELRYTIYSVWWND